MLKFLRNGKEYKETVFTGLYGYKNATQNGFIRLCRPKEGWTGNFSVQRFSHKIAIFLTVMLEFLRNG